jgi:hypothetical protein
MPLAKPANRFRAIRRPIIFLSPVDSGSPLKSGVKFWQQSIMVSGGGLKFDIATTSN